MSQHDMRWAAVAEAVYRRIAELGITLTAFYETAGVSETTLRKMKVGVPLKRADKIVPLTRALGWTQDSIDRLLVGDAPVLASADPVASYDELASLPARVADLERRLAALEAAAAAPPAGNVRPLRSAADGGGNRPSGDPVRRVNRPTGVPADDGPAVED